MGSTAKVSVEEMNSHRGTSTEWYKNWKFLTPIIIVIIALICGFISHYQANHFHANIMINEVKVSGLTSEEALKKLKTTELTNEVFVGQQQILDGKDTKMGFTDKDLPGVTKILRDQRTFFPSSKTKNYSLKPNKQDPYRSEEMKKQLEEKLVSMNKSLTAPKDATVNLKDGKIIVTKSLNGKQYDVASLVKDYEKHENISEIRLKPVYILPIKEDSKIVKKEQKKLQELLEQTVDYKVQDKVHTLNASELIKNASISRDLKVAIDPSGINKKISEINSSQSTLDKSFTFKTHSGSVISVKGQGYGWALDVNRETARIQAAFEKGQKSISASNTYGHGWKNEGYGYDTTANNGIGDTYAEVSLAEQRIWIYKNGKLVVTTNVVTGTHITGQDTSKGVWYILFKRSPAILTGRELGGKLSYSSKVNFWAPFTNDGQGFHDASWRKNWASNAYLADGSHGCVNTPSSVMKTVYANLSIYEPVVIY